MIENISGQKAVKAARWGKIDFITTYFCAAEGCLKKTTASQPNKKFPVIFNTQMSIVCSQ